MTTTAICLAAALGAVALIIVAILVFSPSKEPSKPQGKGDEGVSVSAGEGSIVTVRKVGRMTSVTIRSSVHDHWEGSDSIQVPMIPVEVTRLEKPDLYAEYMSPETSAIRRYEIADELYAEGFSLPYIKGLHEQYKKEIAEALSDRIGDGATIVERTPVDLTHKAEPEPSYANLSINDGLRHAELADMGGGEDSPETEQ